MDSPVFTNDHPFSKKYRKPFRIRQHQLSSFINVLHERAWKIWLFWKFKIGFEHYITCLIFLLVETDNPYLHIAKMRPWLRNERLYMPPINAKHIEAICRLLFCKEQGYFHIKILFYQSRHHQHNNKAVSWPYQIYYVNLYEETVFLFKRGLCCFPRSDLWKSCWAAW